MKVDNINKVSKNEKLISKLKCKVEDSEKVRNLARQHVDSFNYAMGVILKKLPKSIRPLEVKPPEKSFTGFTQSLVISIEELELGTPVLESSSTSLLNTNELYPSECREREINYCAPLFATIRRKFDADHPESFRIKLGNIPIMTRSNFCNLKGKDIHELIKLKEDPHDFGGYFIINGLEKLIRMIAIPRRNYPLAYIRPSSSKKTHNCSEFTIEMKCVRDDLTSHSIALHYINDGNIFLRIVIRKQEFMIPLVLILKALVDAPDILIFNRIVRGNNQNSKLKECVEVIIAEGKKYGFSKKGQFLDYLGTRFRTLMGLKNITNLTNEEVGSIFIKDYIAIHLDDNLDKFNILCLMAEKLYSLAFGNIKSDNLDSPLNHEILLSGHLYLMVLKEKLEDLLHIFELRLNNVFKRERDITKIKDVTWIKNQLDACVNLGKRMEHFLATGNLTSRTGLDLKQQQGYSISAEKINNMRYISHFRSVHRGQFFTTMKTTQPRKLLPESWGFLCPVHTPDGGPCGLLLHLASGCEIISSLPEFNKLNFERTLSTLGMIPISSDLNLHVGADSYPVVLDGQFIGFVNYFLLTNFLSGLRKCKVLRLKNVPETLEIGFIPRSGSSVSLQYPGVFLFTCLARMIRKVKNLSLNAEEYIGPLEQIYLDIACLPEDIRPETTHQELDPMKMLSLVAGLTPFSDYNQSPRNMYQCQMGKQTMGIPFFNFPYRIDNKSYRILFPQSPMVRTSFYEEYGFDNNPSGTNAVVAVLSYTGYDMEDAMIINKSAYERGFGHGIVYKSKTKILNENFKATKGKKGDMPKYRLLNTKLFPEDVNLVKAAIKVDNKFPEHIGSDGLPYVGTTLKQGMVEMVYIDTSKNACVVKFYKETETSNIDEVRIYNHNNPDEIHINIKYRHMRRPVIGDKFSSRHGQKGVLSNLWPQENMPFTENGITPDVIINPHAFPSRMTIGMLIESLAGKSGAMNGKFQDFCPFQQFEDDDAIGFFGKELLDKGFNYYGNEVMYSGTSGMQLKADIYIGVVYYQRLRHMVEDKAQARSLGPIEVLSRQPVKGRKNQGGIRFGEMERDALLAHGASYCLHDRLFNCSDYSEGYICTTCGELLSTLQYKEIQSGSVGKTEKGDIYVNQGVMCKNCNTNSCVKIALPYVLRYLTNELAAMNIKLSFAIK